MLDEWKGRRCAQGLLTIASPVASAVCVTGRNSSPATLVRRFSSPTAGRLSDEGGCGQYGGFAGSARPVARCVGAGNRVAAARPDETPVGRAQVDPQAHRRAPGSRPDDLTTKDGVRHALAANVPEGIWRCVGTITVRQRSGTGRLDSTRVLRTLHESIGIASVITTPALADPLARAVVSGGYVRELGL